MIEIHIIDLKKAKEKIYYCKENDLFSTLVIIKKNHEKTLYFKDIMTAEYNIFNDNNIITIMEAKI